MTISFMAVIMICDSKISFCAPQAESPRFVNIFDNKWSPAPASMDGNKGPILLCVGKQDHIITITKAISGESPYTGSLFFQFNIA